MKLVIFDCDGTLVDSQHNITAAMAHAFAALELEAPSRAAVLGVVGLSLPEAFQVLAPDHARDVQGALAGHYRDAFTSGAISRRADELLYPGIAATVTALAARPDVMLGIATGKSKRGVARLLDREGWQGHFLTIQTADDHPSKPDPSMISKAMADAGVAGASTVMIGDTTFDILMARNAGVGAIGVGWGYHAADRLAAAGAHAIVVESAALLGAIDRRLVEQELGQESGR